MKRLLFAILVATILWFLMFAPCFTHRPNFWGMMVVSALILNLIALPYLWAHREKCVWHRQFLWGVLIACVLWGVFWLGDQLSSLMFNFARPQVESIYGMKDGNAPWLIGLLLLCLIGPAEEFFWRGYVQRHLSELWNPNKAFVVTTLVYTLIHLPSMNFMLIMSALVCGICWGGIYRLFPHYFPAVVISHALWDAAVFVWFPI